MEEILEENLTTDEGMDIGRYARVLLRRWWIIILITAGVFTPWYLHLKSKPPVYQAEAWISFERVNAAQNPNLIQSRIQRLKSRSFAEEVTAELGLTMRLSQTKDQPVLMREAVFQKFNTNQNPVTGYYMLNFYPNGECSFYHGSTRLDSNSVSYFASNLIQHNGLFFTLNPEIAEQRQKVQFTIQDFRSTVSSLIAREDIRSNNAGDLMRITLKDKNPVLASQTVNMLAEIFIQKSLEMRRQSNRLISDYLESQLAVVQERLNQSDEEFKSFQNRHLTGLDNETERVVTRLNALDREINRLQVDRDELNILLKKLDLTSDEFDATTTQYYVYRQIARLEVFRNNAQMTIVRQEIQDKDQMKETFSHLPDRNRRIIELTESIQSLENKIYDLAQQKVVELDSLVADLDKERQRVQFTISQLPEERLKQIRNARERRTNEELYQMLLRRTREAQISESVVSENVSILDPALPPDSPISADIKKKAMLGLFFGLFLGVGAVLLIEELDRSIKTREDINRHLRLPMLGIIPKVKFDSYELQDSEKTKSVSSQIVTHDYSPTPVGEAYRALRTSLLFSKKIGPIRTMVIGSVSPNEGKSFTAANLAITMAQQKTRTLLVDADLRRGVLHNTFNVRKKPGLTNYLTGVVTLDSVLNETYIPNLNLITCGSLIPNPSELLGSFRMKRFIDGINQRFDFVIFDSPPLMAATDAVVLGTMVDGVAVLIRAGKTNRDTVKRKLELFQNVQARLLGVILNGAGIEIAHEGYSYYRY